MRFTISNLTAHLAAIGAANAFSYTYQKPYQKRPPIPEPINIIELPLPPVVSNDVEGSCTPAINPHGTGCMGKHSSLQSGNFLPDGNHVVATLNFTGAPASLDPGSIYTGEQLIVVKADGATFPNGDAWKCITCGVPAANMLGSTGLREYPQAFHDGVRVLVGINIVDCGSAALESDEYTPDRVHIYPIYFADTVDGSGPGLTIRELRIHPDNVHLGFNAWLLGEGEYAFLGRLEFNPSPTTGTPLSARYDLVNATALFNSNNPAPFTIEGDDLIWNREAITVGEARGFTGAGNEVLYVGAPAESCNIDLFAVDLTTGKVRRITEHPEYAHPIDVSRDNKWQVVLDTRGSGRMMFLAGMRHVPPLIDLLVLGSVASVRNNGVQRFFQPYLLDHGGDRGTYFGQQINAAGDGNPGNAGRATCLWGQNPLPCPVSTASHRLMVAHLWSRQPVPPQAVAPISDVVPWGTPWIPGVTTFLTPQMPVSGTYTLHGKVSGFAQVVYGNASSSNSIAVTYFNYTDDGANVLNGFENVTSTPINSTLNHLDWYSNLTYVGETYNTKFTSADGFHLEVDLMADIFQANGTLTTTVDGIDYYQPANDS